MIGVLADDRQRRLLQRLHLQSASPSLLQQAASWYGNLIISGHMKTFILLHNDTYLTWYQLCAIFLSLIHCIVDYRSIFAFHRCIQSVDCIGSVKYYIIHNYQLLINFQMYRTFSSLAWTTLQHRMQRHRWQTWVTRYLATTSPPPPQLSPPKPS